MDEKLKGLARKWISEQDELGERTDHVKGLSEYRIDAAEQAYMAGYEAALTSAVAPTLTEEREEAIRLATHLLAVNPPNWNYAEVRDLAKRVLSTAQPPARRAMPQETPVKENTMKEATNMDPFAGWGVFEDAKRPPVAQTESEAPRKELWLDPELVNETKHEAGCSLDLDHAGPCEHIPVEGVPGCYAQRDGEEENK